MISYGDSSTDQSVGIMFGNLGHAIGLALSDAVLLSEMDVEFRVNSFECEHRRERLSTTCHSSLRILM